MGKRKYKTEEAPPKKDMSEPDEITDENQLQPQSDVLDKPSQKRLKTSKFDVKHFRKDLATKNGQTTVLTQFLQVCLDPDADMDYLLEYLNAGGNSHEILRQLTLDSKKNLTLATPAFHLFHLIILKVQALCPQMISITEEACRYFLNNFMSTVEIMISENSGPRHRRIILKLFTSMVTLNPDLGIEILNQAPLTPKQLQHILEKPNYKEKDNVRTAFVNFMTSFLVDGHLPLIKALLEKQGLLSLVIPGLIQDEPEPVLMFLNILKKNIIENLLISKSLKLKTFNNNVLHQIFRLFYWKGPPETSHDVINEFKPEITSLLSEIILTLFTSSKFGLYFTDPSLGTIDANKNQNLYKAVLSLKRPWENEKQCEILLEIIEKCPDLHRAVVNLIDQNFEPHHSQVWEKTVVFVLKLYEKFKPESMVQRLTTLKPQQAANFIRFATLPVPLLKHLTTALGDTDITLSIHSIKVIVKMLCSLKRYIQILEIEDSKDLEVELKNKLEHFFPKHLPLPSVIVNLIQKCISEEILVQPQSQDYQIPRIDKVESLILLIDLLLLYNDIHPAHFESLEGILNMKEILDYSMSVSEGRVALLKFKVVSLWILLDSSAVSLQNPMFKDLFQILLDVYISDDGVTWMEAKDTVYNFFKSTNIFESNENEIHVMLYALRNCKVESEAIGEAVKYVLENDLSLSDYVRDQMTKLDVTTVQSEINIEKLLEDLSVGKYVRSMSMDTKTSSNFIVGCKQYIINNKNSKKRLKHFLSVYIANLFHSNISSEMMEIVVGDEDHIFSSYVNTWKTEPALLTVKEVGKDETLKNISQYVLNEEQRNLQDLLVFVQLSSEDNYEFKFMDSYYNYVNVDIDKSAIIVWANYLIFSVTRLTELESLDTVKLTRIKELLNVIINFCNKQHLTDVSRNIILATLNNSKFIKIYSPVEHKIESYSLATEFLINFITTYSDIIEHLIKKYNVLKSYQQKNYSEISNALNKIKKKRNINTETIIKSLKEIGLILSDDKQIMKQILELDISDFAKDDKEPSFALEVLTSILTKKAKITNVAENRLTQIMRIYAKLLTNKNVTVNLTNMELQLIEFFETKPHQVKYINDNIFKKFFYASTFRKTTTQLSSLFLKHNAKFAFVFIAELDRPEILSQRELTLPLGEAMLEHEGFISENVEILLKIYAEYKRNIFKVIEKPHKAGQVYVKSWKFVRKLLIECTSIGDCAKVFSKIHKFEVVELSHIHLINALFKKICLNPDNLKPDYVTNYFLCILNLITLSVKESKCDETLNVLLQETYETYAVIQHINRYNNAVDYKKITEAGIWQGFCKAVLKDTLKMKTENDPNNPGPALLFTLTTLIRLFYGNGHEDLTTLFEMATSHSEFLKVMLSHNSPEMKTRLLEFLFTIIKKNPSVMKKQQIPVYLSAYGATKSLCDQLILSILQFYECNGLPVQEYKPYLWGDSAANYYAVRKNKTASLWSQPTPHQIMNLFDKEMLKHTLEQFDVNQKLDYIIALPPISFENKANAKTLAVNLEKDGIFTKQKTKDVEVQIKELVLESKYYSIIRVVKETDVATVSHKHLDTEVYDAAFILPLLSHMLAPGSIASCFKLLRKGLLSVPMMALSSTCPSMRAAAYHVLHRFAMLSETESKHKNDKLLLTDFIDTLRSSLSSGVINNEDASNDEINPRLPAVVALYLAKALIVSTAPFEPLYKPVNNFLIAKQQIDLTVLPDFLSLFHDCDVECADRRNWILNIIRYGTKSMVDVNVVFKTMCIKMIMDFYSSVLCDRKSKEIILNVLDSLLSVPRASEILIEGYGIMSWLHGVICSLKPEDRALFKPLVQILKTVLQSMQINVLSKILNASKTTVISVRDFAVYNRSRVDKELENEIVHLLIKLLGFAEFIEIDDIVFYLNTINLVSRKSLKMISRVGLLNIVNKCSGFCKKTDASELLCGVILRSSAELLNSKVFELSSNSDDQSKDVLKELIKLLKSALT